ncbi:RNA methyltransferase substrate-binding domain-containing protein, partial [Bordetella pertussis]
MASTQVLAGFHAVVARLRHAPESIKEIYVEASRRDKRMQTFLEQAERAGRRVHPVAAERLDGLARGTRHQGVVAVAEE